MRKLLVVGVIGLFLGLACAPSINANVSRDSELVEITTEICGLDGGKHTVQLTREEAEEIDRLFENIRQQLNESTSREEAKEIFNKAVVELDKYGLLIGLNVIQVQRLVNGEYQKTGMIESIERGSTNPVETYDNWNCIIQGTTNRKFTSFYYVDWRILDALLSFLDSLPLPISYLIGSILILIILGTFVLWFPLKLIRVKFPFIIFSDISLGAIIYDIKMGGEIYYYPCKGFIWTLGGNGNLDWNGEFYGNIKARKWGYPEITYDCIGVNYFSGIKIYDENKCNFFGYAKRVSLSRKPLPYP